MTRADDQNGIILLNVLAVVAIASMAILIMVSVQQAGIVRSIRYAEAAQADAYIAGAEASAVIALREDARISPGTDHAGEAWAQIQDSSVAIGNGTFTVRIMDAQAKYNINNILYGASERSVLERLLAALGADDQAGSRIAAYLATAGEARSLDELTLAGLDGAQIDLLGPHLTALPGRTNVNINTASPEVLSAIFNSPVTGQIISSVRDRQGFVTQDDIRQARTLMPRGGGLTSDWFIVTAETRQGETTRRRESLLQRRSDRVDVVRRIQKKAAP